MKKRAAMMQKIKKFVSNNNMLSLAATGGGAILGFISFVLLVGNTDKEVFGAWAFYISTATMLDMAKTGFVQTPLVRHLAAAKSSAEQDTIIASGFAASLVLTFLLALIVFTAPLLFPQLLDNKAFSLFLQATPSTRSLHSCIISRAGSFRHKTVSTKYLPSALSPGCCSFFCCLLPSASRMLVPWLYWYAISCRWESLP